MASFNESSDKAFAALVDAGVIASINPLIGLRPSQLDFGRKCLATLDVKNHNGASAPVNNIADESVHQISHDIQLLLPDEYSNASLLDTLGYWVALQRLEATREVIDGAVEGCRQRGDLAVKDNELDFTRSCSDTSRFWWKFLFSASKNPEEMISYEDDDVVQLFRSAIPSVWSTFANATILEAVKGLLDTEGVNDTITQAANDCASTSCLALDYAGSNDIAGIGAVISYACICAFTVIVVIMCLYLYRTTHGDIQPSTPAKRAAIRSSLVFGDTVMFFTIMTSLAANIYNYRAQSFYEYTLSSLTAFMAFNASCLLAILDLYPREIDLDFRTVTRIIALSMAFSIVFPVLSKLLGMQEHAITWIDMPCYGTNLWPTTFLWICGFGSVATWLPFSIWGLIVAYWRIRHRKSYNLENKFPPQVEKVASTLHAIGVLLSFFFMWISLVSIFIVRDRAKKMFGPSYADDAFGFGQVVASGFCLQMILQYIYIRYVPPKCTIDASMTRLALIPFGVGGPRMDMKLLPSNTFRSGRSHNDESDRNTEVSKTVEGQAM